MTDPAPNGCDDSDPAGLTIHTALNDAQPVCIRAIRSGDEGLMRAGLQRMSPRSRYLRFFSGMPTPPDWLIERLITPDSDTHLAWGAIDTGMAGEPAIGAVHAFRDPGHPDRAEFSIAILDDYHGRGLGKLLTATLLLDARRRGIEEFVVHVLGENTNALAFIRLLGGETRGLADGVYEYRIYVDQALARLKEKCDPPGMAKVFVAFG